jgi:hypothetical protein
MPEQKERRIYDREFQRLNDLNVSGFWWHGGVEWTSIIKEEIVPDSDETLEHGKPQSLNKPVFYSALAILVLLSLAIITRASNMIPAVQANEKNMSQQISYSHK